MSFTDLTQAFDWISLDDILKLLKERDKEQKTIDII